MEIDNRVVNAPRRYVTVNANYINSTCTSRNLENKQKCIFLDRDGTINELVPFLADVEKFKLIPKVAEAIKMINSSEYLCIVITNQPVIARGDCTFENLDLIHRRMETLLGQEGAYIDGLYYCPHHKDKGFPGEVPELKFDCECRKPKIGMVKQASEDFNIDLSQSIMIGDSTMDIQMAKNAGMQSILVKTGSGGTDGKYDVEADLIEADLYSAIGRVLNNGNKQFRLTNEEIKD